jgi:Beta-ketoacyl synthase, N-terminal domain
MQMFSEWVNSKDAGVAARCLPLKIFSAYHNAHMLSEAAEKVMKDVQGRKINLLGRQTLSRTAYDIVKGAPLPSSLNETELTRLLVESNFIECNRFELVCETAVESLKSFEGHVELFCSAPSVGLATNLADQLRASASPASPKITVKTYDLTQSETLTSVQSEAHTFVSAENDAVAVVAMTCRLPGDVNSPEDFWRFLKEGKSSVSEVSEKSKAVTHYVLTRTSTDSQASL